MIFVFSGSALRSSPDQLEFRSGTIENDEMESPLSAKTQKYKTLLKTSNTLVKLLENKNPDVVYRKYLSAELKQSVAEERFRQMYTGLLEQIGPMIGFKKMQWYFILGTHKGKPIVTSVKIVYHSRAVMYYMFTAYETDHAKLVGFRYSVKRMKKTTRKQVQGGKTDLILAVEKGQVKEVRRLIRSGVDVNETDASGNTALLEAIVRNHIEIFDLLIKLKVNVEAANKHGYTALIIACRHGSPRMVRALLKKGANINLAAVDARSSESPLMAAAGSSGSAELVELLLDKGARVNAHDSGALRAAALDGTFETIRLLIRRGANVNNSNRKNYSPLLRAAREKRWAIVRYLIAKGARVNARGKDGESAIDFAASAGNYAAVKFLIDSGAKVNVVLNSFTPLLRSCHLGHQPMVRLLLRHGADPKVKGRFGTCRAIARKYGYKKVLLLLPRK